MLSKLWMRNLSTKPKKTKMSNKTKKTKKTKKTNTTNEEPESEVSSISLRLERVSCFSVGIDFKLKVGTFMWRTHWKGSEVSTLESYKSFIADGVINSAFKKEVLSTFNVATDDEIINMFTRGEEVMKLKSPSHVASSYRAAMEHVTSRLSSCNRARGVNHNSLGKSEV